MNFSTKAQTLKNLKKIGFNIPKLNIYKVKDFQKDKNKIIKNIQHNFKDKIAIRSSSTKEDVMGKTNAGKYKSFLNIDPTKTEKVITSIKEIIRDYDKDGKNELFSLW